MAQDAARMRDCGFSLVRMGEFAWHLFEPEAGRFCFDWMDEAIARLAAAGIRTLLCTPTATPPRWLTAAHPEVLRVAADGQPLRHGSRQHASHFSSVFRAHSRRITAALAAHYAGNPHVAGWQTDNEFHCHFAEDHHPEAQTAFRDFLRERYANDLQALNRAWGGDFWAQAYTDFDQIETPIAHRPTHLNPSQVLDYQRFLSWGVARFQREQVEILRAAQPAWWVTHNGCFASIDYRGEFTRDLDFLSYDSYPFFDPQPANRRFSHAFNLDWVRAYSGNFMIPEQQAGPGGQTDYLHETPEPGEMRRMALTSIAHGADGLLFFRWRSCRFGAEEYWCGLIDHDNVPRGRLQEAARLGAELQRLGPALAGSTVRIDVAVAGGDFDSQAAHQALHHGLPGPRQAAETVHGALQARQAAVGIVHPSDSLQGIGVYWVPHLPLFLPAWVPGIAAWVQEGGTLIVGPRCATKDLNNHVIAGTPPGCLRTLTGTQVEAFTRLNRPELRPLELRLHGETLSAVLWAEALIPDADTEVLAVWETRAWQGKAAITRRAVGRGQVIHVGTWLTAELTRRLADLLDRGGRMPPAYALPEGLEAVERLQPDGTRLRFVINHTDTAVNLPLSGPCTDVLSGETLADGSPLPPNGVRVLRLPDGV